MVQPIAREVVGQARAVSFAWLSSMAKPCGQAPATESATGTHEPIGTTARFCIRQGGEMYQTRCWFKRGNTVCAYHSEVQIDSHPLAEVKSASRKKAVIMKVRKSSLKVKFKHDAHVERIPKKWAELNSSRKLQVCAGSSCQPQRPCGLCSLITCARSAHALSARRSLSIMLLLVRLLSPPGVIERATQNSANCLVRTAPVTRKTIYYMLRHLYNHEGWM